MTAVASAHQAYFAQPEGGPGANRFEPDLGGPGMTVRVQWEYLPRHPGTTELERAPLHLARGHSLPQPHAVGNAPDVPGVQGVLTLDDALNQAFDLAFGRDRPSPHS